MYKQTIFTIGNAIINHNFHISRYDDKIIYSKYIKYVNYVENCLFL